MTRSFPRIKTDQIGFFVRISYTMLDPANDASKVKLFLINISFHMTTRPVDSLHRWI